MREGEIDISKLDFCFDFVQNGSLFRFIFLANWILCKHRADETKVRVPHKKQQRPNSGRDIFIYSCLKISKNCCFFFEEIVTSFYNFFSRIRTGIPHIVGILQPPPDTSHRLRRVVKFRIPKNVVEGSDQRIKFRIP